MDNLNNFENINDILKDYMEDTNFEENSEDIDIRDYIPAEEEVEYDKFLNLLNIYNCYYKQLHNKSNDSTLFDNIDYDNDESTNKCLEFLYEEIFKFKKCTDEDKDILYEPNNKEIKIDNWDEMHVLYINNEPKYVSKFLITLLQYLATIDWTEINWKINPFKN